MIPAAVIWCIILSAPWEDAKPRCVYEQRACQIVALVYNDMSRDGSRARCIVR